MILAWNIHLVIASLTLAGLSLLTWAITRRAFTGEPRAAHGSLVFLMMVFLVTLPVQLGMRALPSILVESASPAENAITDTFIVPEPMRPFEEHVFGSAPEPIIGHEAYGLQDPVLDTQPDDPSDSAFFEEAESAATAFEPPEDLSELLHPETAAAEVLEPETVTESQDSAQALVEPTGPDYQTRAATFVAPLVRTPWLMIIHLAGIFVALIVAWIRLQKTHGIIKRSVVVRDDKTLEVWRKVAGRDARRIRLLASTEINAPVCWGIVRPVVIIPADNPVRDDTPAFTWALRHELVHIRRGDPRTTLLQCALRAVFWFHPSAWWLNRELDRLREISCDDVVVGRTGSRKSYAMALIEYARRSSGRAEHQMLPPTAPALISWSGSASQLERRIKMLARTRNERSALRQTLLGGSCALIALLLVTAQVTFAATMPAPQSTEEKPGKSGAEDADPVELMVITEEAEKLVIGVDATSDEPAAAVKIGRAPQRRDAVIGIDARALQDDQKNWTIGLHLEPFSASLAKNLGMPRGSGLIVTRVVEGSHAERAGLKDNDPIIKIDGNHATMEEIRAAKKRSNGKKPIKFMVMRGASLKTVTVRFAKNSGRAPSTASGVAVPRATNKRRALPSGIIAGSPTRSTTPRAGGIRSGVAAGVPARPSRGAGRASSRERGLERQVDTLEKRLDRLTRMMERQQKMLQELMQQKRRNSGRSRDTGRRSSRRSSPSRIDGTREDRRRDAELRAAEEAFKKAQARREGAERERMDAEEARRDEVSHYLRELEARRAAEKALYHERLTEQRDRLAHSTAQLAEVETALAELKNRRNALSAERAAIADPEIVANDKKKMLAELGAAEKKVVEEIARLRHSKERSKIEAEALRARNKATAAEYEARLAELEAQTEALKKQLQKTRARKRKAAPKDLEIIDFSEAPAGSGGR